MLKINKNSIAFKLSRVMIMFILLQLLFLVGSYVFSGIVDELKNHAYSTYFKNVDNRKDDVEDKMNLYFRNFNSYAYEIMDMYDKNISSSQTIDDQEINNFLLEVGPELIEILRTTMTTGAFVILDNDDSTDTYSTIYLKDDDPIFNNEDDDDILILKGPLEVARELQLPLLDKWNYGIALNEKNLDILKNPIEAIETIKNEDGEKELKEIGKKYDIDDLGYWKVSPNLSESGISMVTYSIPLLDANENVFGVMGVEISQDYFYEMLPNNEIYRNSSLGYIVAIHDKNTGEIIPVLTEGVVQNNMFELGVPLEWNVRDENFAVYDIVNAKADESILGCVQNMTLYGKNTPFEHEQWMLIGLVEEGILFNVTNSFTSKTIGIFLLSSLVSIILVFFVGKNFAKPIVRLAKEVRRNDLKTVTSLSRTGYSEIDDLSIAIERFNRNILDEIFKTDKIIRMANLPLATFEYKKDTEQVNCSDRLLDLLHMDSKIMNKNSVDCKYFFNALDIIKENIEEEEKQIYLLKGNLPSWVKIVTVEQEDIILGVVMDVTSEVLEKHAMKFERDYDQLTKLLNRFAFKRKVEDIFQKGLSDFSAFALFDLDNLKYINDTYGHDMGDAYIKEAARLISDNLQENCVVGRMSGDEFYVFLYKLESKDIIRDKLQSIYESLELNPIILPNGNQFKIRMSGGLAWFGDDSKNLNELIRYADFAMYQGKNTIKGEIREYDKVAYSQESFMLSGGEELNKILDNQLVDYVFQPIISAVTGKIYAYETLMRPQSDVLSSPLKLLQIATAQSQLWKIEKITFYKSLSLYRRYRRLFGNCRLFINSIPNETLKEKEYLELEHLYPEVLEHIVIEITENEKLNTSVLDKKRALVKRWGGEMALDDYGSGYNGDISLLMLSPHIVKIDRYMIEGIDKDRNRQSIVQKLLLYAREQEILVLAEGVETYEQMKYLVNIGVDLLQGFYIDRPRPLPDFETTKIEKEIDDIKKGGN